MFEKYNHKNPKGETSRAGDFEAVLDQYVKRLSDYDRETGELLKATKDYKYAETPMINCLQDILWELRYIRRKIDRPE